MAGKLVELISTLDERESLAFVDRALAEGVLPADILADAREGLSVVGQRFSAGEYFIPELVYSGEILKGIIRRIEPHLKTTELKSHAPRIVIGTVAGDIHDIGKNLVTFLLDVSGFGVLDLGVDVPSQRFIDAVQQTSSGVVALSGFLTSAFFSMKETIEAIGAAGLRDQVKIMVGGGQVDEQVCRYTGADAFGSSAADAVKLAKTWLGE